MAFPTNFPLTTVKWLLPLTLLLCSPMSVWPQSITLLGTNSSSCTYTTLTLRQDRSIEVQCDTGAAPSPGTVAFTASSGSAASGGAAVDVTVRRSGNNGGDVSTSVSFSCVSAPQTYIPQVSPVNSLTFTTNESKAVRITPTALPTGVTSATVTCTLVSASNGVTIVSPSAYVLTVTSGGGSSGACPTPPSGVANYSVSSTSTRAAVVGLQNEGTAAVSFPASAGTSKGGVLSLTTPVVGYAATSQFEVAFSECPGSFVVPANNATTDCAKFVRLGSISMIFDTAGGLGACRLSPDRQYYLNLRWRSSTGASTCLNSAGCSAYVDLVYR